MEQLFGSVAGATAVTSTANTLRCGSVYAELEMLNFEGFKIILFA